MIAVLWQLFWLFALLSMVAFGGGAGVIPDIQRAAVDVHHWLTAKEFLDLFAISRAAPGPGSMIAALVGQKAAGVAGAIVAFIAMFGPSSVVVFSSCPVLEPRRAKAVARRGGACPGTGRDRHDVRQRTRARPRHGARTVVVCDHRGQHVAGRVHLGPSDSAAGDRSLGLSAGRWLTPRCLRTRQPIEPGPSNCYSMVVDPVWYRARYRDVAASGVDPLRHFIDLGLRERRDPNRWFDGAWYAPPVRRTSPPPGHTRCCTTWPKVPRQGRDPHPRFDAGWYIGQHPEAAGNPLLFHLRVGAARGWLTERPVAIEDYLPSARTPFVAPPAVAVDVIVPVYRDLAVTRRCIGSVLADGDRSMGRVIVIDDRSPEPKLSAWLDRLAKSGAIVLLRNKRNLGFVASVNRGMRHAGQSTMSCC